VDRSVGSLFSEGSRGPGAVRETGRNPKWERSHHDSIVPMEDTSVTLPPSTNPSRGRSGAHDLDPSASSIASRVRSPVRGKVGAIAAAWNRVTGGVRESSSRGYVPLLLTVGGRTPRLTGLSGRCVCVRSGSLRKSSTPIALDPATIEGLFPSFGMESRIHAMRAHSGARRRVVRQQGRPVAKTREASPREATSCRDLVRRAARRKRTRVKNGCRARNTGPLQGSRASRAKVSSAEETPDFHEAGCANRSWSV